VLPSLAVIAPPLTAKFDRLLALRGDPVKGLAATDWGSALEGVPQDVLMRAAHCDGARACPSGVGGSPKDDAVRRKALESNRGVGSLESVETLKAIKWCRQRLHGRGATRRLVMDTAFHKPRVTSRGQPGADDSSGVFEAIQSVEEELLSRIALMSEYHRGPEAAALNRRGTEAASPSARALGRRSDPESRAAAGPVPYNAMVTSSSVSDSHTR